MRVLVCGGRDYTDEHQVRRVLTKLPITVLIEGCARGADSLGEDYARALGIPLAHFPAEWRRDGRTLAGPIRNQRMLDEGRPELVVAFPGGRGTADMVRRAERAGVPVYRVAAGGQLGGSLGGSLDET